MKEAIGHRPSTAGARRGRSGGRALRDGSPRLCRKVLVRNRIVRAIEGHSRALRYPACRGRRTTVTERKKPNAESR
jgi:hypothetical protein